MIYSLPGMGALSFWEETSFETEPDLEVSLSSNDCSRVAELTEKLCGVGFEAFEAARFWVIVANM